MKIQYPVRENYLPNLPEPRQKKREKDGNLCSRYYHKVYQIKKKYWLNIWGFLFLLTIFLNLYYFQPISWSKFSAVFDNSKSQHKTFNTSYIILLIFGAFFFIFNDLILAKLSFSSYLSQFKIKKITTLEWLKLLSITFFIRSITPFSIGSEPYTILWLKRRGIALRQASVIVSSLTVSWFLAQGLITWPSFIYLQTNQLGSSAGAKTEFKYYWVIITGLIVDLISTAFVFTISYCKRIHYFFGLIRLKFRYFLKKEELNVSLSRIELRKKYLKNKSFKRDFKRTFFSLRTIKAVIVFSIQNVLSYSLYALLALFLMQDQTFPLAFHIINISTTSNNFIPTPGSEGSIQFTIEKMNALAYPLNILEKSQANSEPIQETVFLWRWFQRYQPFILSSIFICIYTLSRYFRSKLQEKAKKLNLKKDIYLKLISLYTVNGSLIQLD